MITLKLANFRCYDQERTFTFPCHQVIRLQGKSGIGKTTLFEAIQWVLYNYPTTNIYPRHGKSKDTFVSLTLPHEKNYITIERKKNPSLLTLTFHINGRKEEDDVAQGTIESLFGPRLIWQTCCYLPQGEFSPLLGFTNLQRMEILETLAFLNTKPEEDLMKIDKEVHRLEITHATIHEKLNLITAQIKERQFPSSIAKLHLSDKKRQEIMALRQELKEKITSLEEEIILTREREKQHRLINERIKKLEYQLNSLPNTSLEEISSLEERIKTNQEKLPYVKEKETYLALLSRQTALEEKINLLPVPYRDYTDEEYHETLTREKKIHEEEKLAERWKIKYREKEVKSRISKIKELLDQEKERHIWLKIKSLEKKLSRLTKKREKEEEITQDKINQLRDEIKTMKQSSDVYKCPACQRSLRYLRGNLVLSETSPIPLDRINNLQEELVEQEHKYHEQEERKNLKLQLDSLYSTVTTTYSPDSDINVKKLERELQDLQRLTFPKRPPVSGQAINKAREYYRLKQELDQVISDLSHYSNVLVPEEEVTTAAILKILDHDQKKLKQLNETLSQYESLENQIKTYQHDLSKYVITHSSKELQTMINQRRQEEEELVQRLKDDQLAQEYLHLKQQEQEALTKFQRSDKELSSALRLRDIAKQEICEIIEEKITYINSLISDISQRIFQDPITVELSLLKTTKTTKTTKPYVHLKIAYHDGEYDTLHQLSGGEGKRISLAISLALSLANNFPIVLLDECLNGLDDELKELSLTVLKEMSENKTIICIMHDGVTGYYDEIVNLTN